MGKVIFHNRTRSFLLIALFGVIGGALVGFFEQYPHDDLWAFALFGSMTIGFWMCTTSLIVLFSEKFYTAGINAFLYVAFIKETSFVYHNKRGFFLHFGRKTGKIQ